MSTKSKADIKSEQTQQKHQQQQEQNGSAIDVLNITNTLLAILIVYALYKLFGKKKRNDDGERFRLPDPLPKHDMTLDELRRYDGTGPDKRICLAILGRVYDCTKGHEYYGPGGAYSPLAGRDASRALALFDLSAVKDEWDDITDLDSNQLSSVMEWNEQFQERYDYIGRLVRSKEEILERADFEEDIDIGGEKQKKSSMKNDKQQHSSTTDDDEIEVINSSEQESTNGNMGNTSKKVSFMDAKHKKNDSGDDGKKLSESSDDIEVIETAAKNDTDN
ncbi:membrane-associated progesterone receptor component 1-like isoform X1 [Dermatophagoides pteronyssinus]|uniref:membrane-associated progesterone receptor component 1-like isoform X1 n=1 Tax=Dermatophagoides pteronyssinus TaxID=6956 RepID=UPI003F66D288